MNKWAHLHALPATDGAEGAEGAERAETAEGGQPVLHGAPRRQRHYGDLGESLCR